MRPLTVDDVRHLPPISSSFETDRVYRLQRLSDGLRWELREERLKVPFGKMYDDGSVDTLLDEYGDAGPVDRLRFLGAFREWEFVGLVLWQYAEWNDTVWLMDIRVDAEDRRRGVGARLVEALEQQARELGARGINVETQINNLPAIDFYRKRGFVIAGFHDHLYGNDDLRRQDVALYLFKELAAGRRGI